MAQLLNIKSDKIGGLKQQSARIQMKFDNVDNGDIHDMMGEREAAYGQEEDANLDVIEQLDSKIQEVEGEN